VDIEAMVKELRAIEQRYAPASGAGPEAYAQQLTEWRTREPDREEVCSTGDATGAWLVVMLCARYGIRPFRRPRQKPTTICLLAPASFVSKVFWPQVQEMARVFEAARVSMVNQVVGAWLGATGDQVLIVEEERGG
jgi:hypothetical protein